MTETTARDEIAAAAQTLRQGTPAVHPNVAQPLAEVMRSFAITEFDPEATIQVADARHERMLAVARAVSSEHALAAVPSVSRAAVLREAAEHLIDLRDSLITAPETTGQYLAGLERAARELRRLADEERDEQEAQANLDQLADLLPRMADEVQPCDGCGHPEHSARECPVTLYGERCACDEPLAAEAPPATTHSCGNCEGIDPDTCLMNPNRPPEQCPNSEFDGYGLQCQKPAGHNLCTFEEEAAETTHVVGDASETPECVDDCPGCEQEQHAAENRCPRCGESLANYIADDLVYRKGDARPYCSGECVVAANRGYPMWAAPAAVAAPAGTEETH